jgi:hypothetical protein
MANHGTCRMPRVSIAEYTLAQYIYKSLDGFAQHALFISIPGEYIPLLRQKA